MRLLLSSCCLLVLSVVVLSAPDAARAERPNWLFMPGNYSHDPRTGERITQYAPSPAVEALPDTRSIASGYHRSRINQFGPGGTVDTYYRVENWSNTPGGLDAQWERVNDVWQRSTLSGGFGYGSPAYGPYNQFHGRGGGFQGPGFGGPFYGQPGAGYPGYPGGGYPGPGFGPGPY